jgi:hypothetical protein
MVVGRNRSSFAESAQTLITAFERNDCLTASNFRRSITAKIYFYRSGEATSMVGGVTIWMDNKVLYVPYSTRNECAY